MPIEISQLENKHILLDTCFLIKAYKYSASPKFFEDLFLVFEKNNCVPVINEFIKFEFLRNCNINQHIIDKKKFLEKLSGIILPITPNIFTDAIDIANIYKNKNVPHKIEIVDHYISAFLKQYQKHLVLATLNNVDYPIVLHDRIGIYTIDSDSEIMVIGFYSFNVEKFNKSLSDIKKLKNFTPPSG